MKLVHIINPVKVNPSSDLFVAQPVVFQSLHKAKEYAGLHQVRVELWSAQYEEDKEFIPEFIQQTPNLSRSVLDFGHFKKTRKLPLIADILDKAAAIAQPEDYIIYTNADIAVLPYFYTFIAEEIGRGTDALVINRRTIKPVSAYATLDEMYADIGKTHPGFDCFVIAAKQYAKYRLGKVCIGTTKIGVSLLANMICYSKNFKLLKESHLTFHNGEDQPWLNTELDDYVHHNVSEASAIFDFLFKNESVKMESSPLMVLHNQKLKEAMKGESTNLAPSKSFWERIKGIKK